MANAIKQDGTFEFWYEANLAKGEDGKRWIEGIASTDHKDLQGEKIKQDGLELSYFLKRGYFNDDHAKETSGKVGIPTEARITSKGLWTKGFLLDTPRANGIWDLAEGLKKAGDARKLGFSVEGKVLSRDASDHTIITKAWIKDIAITASPINPNTFLDIAKSFASQKYDEVLVFGENEEAINKGVAADVTQTKTTQKPDTDTKPEDEEKKADNVLERTEEATKSPVVNQIDVEEKDALDETKRALSDKKPKQDMEKQLDDVPLAKKGVESEPLFTIEVNQNGDVVIKGKKSTFKLPKEDQAIVPDIEEGKALKGDEQGHEENKTMHSHAEADSDKNHKEIGPIVNGVHRPTTAKKSIDTDLEKGIEIEPKISSYDPRVNDFKIGHYGENKQNYSHVNQGIDSGIHNGIKNGHGMKPLGMNTHKTVTSFASPEKGMLHISHTGFTHIHPSGDVTTGTHVGALDSSLKAPKMPISPITKSISSIDNGWFEKSTKWTTIHSHGGEIKLGDKKMPLHSVTYEDKDKKHQVSVSGDGDTGAFAVLHALPNAKGTLETIGSRIFADDPKTGAKGKDKCKKYLDGFGINHKFLDKNKLIKKALICAADSTEACDVCKEIIIKGNMYMVEDGHSYCDDSCIEKALVTGYAFGVTDQTGGSALRVESLEGQQKDLSYGKVIAPDLKTTKVEFDTARANGGQTYVTLRDALDFLVNRGIPEAQADRILLLMVKNDGDISGLAQKVKK